MKEVVELIDNQYSGSESEISLERRMFFPGLGGAVITAEGVPSAFRYERDKTPKTGHKLFLKHTLIKKLEDFFFRTGVYVVSHIARPLGSVSRHENGQHVEGYIYEWVFGSEGFPWEVASKDGYTNIHLEDWDRFIKHFSVAGISMMVDVADPDDGRVSKNVIHQYPYNFMSGKLSSLWRRIDFGPRSLRIDYDRLSEFINEHLDELIRVLRAERVNMLRLIVEYLHEGPEQMSQADIGRLEILVGDYRRATLTQYQVAAGATHIPAHLTLENETLL